MSYYDKGYCTSADLELKSVSEVGSSVIESTANFHIPLNLGSIFSFLQKISLFPSLRKLLSFLDESSLPPPVALEKSGLIPTLREGETVGARSKSDSARIQPISLPDAELPQFPKPPIWKEDFFSSKVRREFD